jgi:hypothetical protein
MTTTRPAAAPTFANIDCRTCGDTKPEFKFPTTTRRGELVRVTECRQCRDARRTR